MGSKILKFSTILKTDSRLKLLFFYMLSFALGFVLSSKDIVNLQPNLSFILSLFIFSSILFFSIIRKMLKINKDSCLFSIIVSTIYVTGRIYSKFDTIIPHIGIKYYFYIFISFCSFFILFLSIYNWLLDYFEILESECNKLTIIYKKNKRLPLFLGIFLYYSICLYIFRPNLATFDTYNQIQQAFGWLSLRNDNPLFHTLLMRLVLKTCFAITGSVLKSIFVFELIQIFVFSIITTLVIIFIENTFEKKSFYVRLLEAFYFVNPLVCWYIVILWKDIWISYFVLGFMLYIYKCINSDFFAWKTYILLFIFSLGTLNFKGTGIIFVSITLLTIICEKSLNIKNKTIISLILLSTIIFYCSAISIATNKFNIAKHNSADTESIIWQTTARTLKYHKEELPSNVINELEKFIDTEKAVEVYDSQISDPIKGYCLRYDYFKANRIKCIKLWLFLGLKYPKTYINAIYGSSYGYLYPEVTRWCFCSSSYVQQAEYWSKLGLVDPYVNNYDLSYAEKRAYKISRIELFLNKLRKIPLIRCFASIGFYFILYLFMIIFAIKRRIKKSLIIFAIPIGVYISCILSPVYAEMRYAYPAIISMPLCIAILVSLLKLSGEKNDSYPNS